MIEATGFLSSLYTYPFKTVIEKQCTGTGAIKSQIPLLKPKWEINKNTNRQKTMRTNGQPSVQLFPKRWSLNSQTRTKSIMNKHKVKHHQIFDTTTGQREPHQNHRLRKVSNELLWGGGGGLKLVKGPNLTLRN